MRYWLSSHIINAKALFEFWLLLFLAPLLSSLHFFFFPFKEKIAHFITFHLCMSHLLIYQACNVNLHMLKRRAWLRQVWNGFQVSFCRQSQKQAGKTLGAISLAFKTNNCIVGCVSAAVLGRQCVKEPTGNTKVREEGRVSEWAIHVPERGSCCHTGTRSTGP